MSDLNSKVGQTYAYEKINDSRGLKSLRNYTLKLSDKDQNLKEAKNDPANFMVNLIRQQRSLYKKDIQDWIAARMEAENPDYPRRLRLYDLYYDIILDGFIHGQIYNQRILKISNKKFKIVNHKTKEEDENKTDLLDRMWFNRFVKLSMESIFFGHSLIYIKTIDTEIREVELVYREHVLPDLNVILKHPSDYNGINFTKPPYDKYCIGVGDRNDLGLLNKAAPLWIFKKHSWQNWDEFEEIFGIPLRYIKTATQDKRVLNEMEAWLQEMGSAPYGIFPSDAEITLEESKRPDAFGVFNEKRKAANEELAILFNGQTMTTMDGSSKSQAEVHERTQDEVTEDDLTFIRHLINYRLIPMLIRNGYDFSEDDRFIWNDEEQLSTIQRLKKFKGVVDLGFDIDQKQVENEFGITITGRRQSGAQAPAKEDKEDVEQEDKKDDENMTVKQILNMHKEITKLYNV